MHNAGNDRIYQAFLGLDDYITTHNVQRARNRGPIRVRFGPLYQTWYSNYLQQLSRQSFNYVQSGLALIASKGYAGAHTAAVQALRNSHKATAQFLTIQPGSMTWNGQRSLRLHRRDQPFSDGSCKLAGLLTTAPSQTIPSTLVTSGTSTQTAWPCVPSGNENDVYSCICTNGVTLPTVSASDGDICPWSTLPPAAYSKQAASATISSS